MTHAKPVANRLLEALPSGALVGIRSECELVELTRGDVLCEPGDRIRDVYFPAGSFVSLIARAADTADLEVALVGSEGMVGIPLLLGADTKPWRVLVQGSGHAWRMSAEIFRGKLAGNPQLHRELSSYVSSRLAQLAQNALCSCSHSLEARLARRLLMTQDRAHADDFHATQEMLAKMLGVRRSSVTCAAAALRDKKIIRYRRGSITVLDRVGLENVSCGCHQIAMRGRGGLLQ